MMSNSVSATKAFSTVRTFSSLLSTYTANVMRATFLWFGWSIAQFDYTDSFLHPN